MLASLSRFDEPARSALLAGLLVMAGAGLSGCADMSDSMTAAFADPAKYELYNCKQLEAERKELANRLAQLQGLMAKAQTGVGGPVVAEVAYSNDYIAVRGQVRYADAAWARNKCRESPREADNAAKPAPAPDIRSGRSQIRSGGAVY